MRILFICGCLEPGKDGVGDYVHALARSLTALGHEIFEAAINDPFVDVPLAKNCGCLQVLRLPRSMKASKKQQLLQQVRHSFSPNWISLQFVPYAYHPKGLPLRLATLLQPVTRNLPVHLFVHETWIGVDHKDGLQLKAYAWLQKWVIRNLLQRLQPRLVHTHLPHFKHQLRRIGWVARPLPLFSNFEAAQLQVRSEVHPSTFTIGSFSRFSPFPDMVDFLTKLAREVQGQGMNLRLILWGGNDQQQQQLASFVNQHAIAGLTVIRLGFVAAEEAASLIAGCDLGLTPVPLHALGKSGSVSAFLAQGIPVAAPSKAPVKGPYFFSTCLRNAIVTLPSLEAISLAQPYAAACCKVLDIGKVADQFLNDLMHAQQANTPALTEA